MKRWVLLRGLMRESRHWGDFAAQLQNSFPEDQIICLDWPGNGVLHQHRSLSSITEMVRFLQHTLIEQSFPAPYHVVAVSLGAMVAVEWARLAPKDIAHATLINTSLKPINPFYQRLRPSNYATLLAMLFSSPSGQERKILQLTSNRPHTATLKQWIEYQQQCPIARSNILRQLWAAATYCADATPPLVPLQLLSSQNDRLVDNQCSHTLAQLWHIPHAIHPSAGHDLPLDDPAWVIKHLLPINT